MTPITRKRRSPTRSHSPRAGRAPNNSLATVAPITQTGWLWRGSPSGRKLPCAISICRMSISSAVDPSTGDSRLRAPARTSPAPMISGAMRRTAWLRLSASASSSVKSRGVLPTSTPGMAPAVSLRPGRTMIRLLPSEPNWFATYSRAPSPSAVTITTAATPMPIASRISSVRASEPRTTCQAKSSRSATRMLSRVRRRRRRRRACAGAGASARRSRDHGSRSPRCRRHGARARARSALPGPYGGRGCR